VGYPEPPPDAVGVWGVEHVDLVASGQVILIGQFSKINQTTPVFGSVSQSTSPSQLIVLEILPRYPPAKLAAVVLLSS